MSLRAAIAAIALTLSVAASSIGKDWSQWRGPTFDGHADHEDLADSWPEGGPPLLWAHPLGQGYSAFAIHDGRAYTQTQSLYDQSLICLDVDTGETLWTHRYGWPYDGGGLYPGPRSTPAVVDGRVYYASPEGTIGCVDAARGTSVWQVNPKEKYRGRGTDFGVSASPVVWQNLVIIPTGGRGASLVALHASTGEVAWTCGDLPASYATPIVVSLAGRWIVIAPLENSLLCADALTGQFLWELDLSQGYDEHSASLVYREPLLFMAGPFRSGGRCWRLIPRENSTGCRPEPVWDARQMSNDIASCVLVGDALFGFDLKDMQSRVNRPSRGEFRCLDWNSGKTLWSSDLPGHAHVIACGQRLLMFNDRGELILARASQDGYEELERTAIFPDEICWTHPVIADGRVILRTQSRAACVYVGRELPRPVNTNAPPPTIPQVTRFDATVLVGGEREFPAATPEWGELWLWFRWTLCGLVVAWGAAAVVGQAVGWYWHATLFVIAVLSLGGTGSWLLNSPGSEYVFTWPLTLWGLLHATLGTSLWAIRGPASYRNAWLARGTILLLVGGSALYFHFCRQLGLAIEWSFLVGYPAAVPVALGHSWFESRRGSPSRFRGLVAAMASYSCYFWGSVAFMKWWCQVGS